MPAPRPFILVLAGVNGAGKSSVGGALLQQHGLAWFNPDRYARSLVEELHLTQDEADSRAWLHSRELLERAISEGSNHAFETTLGGNTFAALLLRACQSHDVMILFCGLASVEQHIARVRLRVAHGGHDIPEQRIRERWTTARSNLIRLLPQLARLQVFDNSAEAAPGEEVPDPVLVLEMAAGRITFPQHDDIATLSATPDWAKPILQAAIELQTGR